MVDHPSVLCPRKVQAFPQSLVVMLQCTSEDTVTARKSGTRPPFLSVVPQPEARVY